MANDQTTGDRSVPNYAAQRTVTALPAEARQLFENDPLTDYEVQQWWANWDPATMHMTLPAYALHARRQ